MMLLCGHHDSETDLVNFEVEEIAVKIVLKLRNEGIILVALRWTPSKFNLEMSFAWWGDQNSTALSETKLLYKGSTTSSCLNENFSQ